MLKPEYLLRISEGAENIAEQLHNDILKRIIDRLMARIGRGEEQLLSATDKWQIEAMQESGYLLEDIQKDIAKRTNLQVSEIKEAMEDAGVKALEYDDAIYRAAGLSTVSLFESPYMVRVMQRNYEATLGEWNNFTRSTAQAAQTAYYNAVDRAYTQVTSGAVSYTQAVQEAVNNMCSQGVYVHYDTGRRDTIETATLRAVRTGVSQATAEVQLARMKEMGASLAITSSHLGARPTHEPWQGKVYYIDWNKMPNHYPLEDAPLPETNFELQRKYPDFVESTGYGRVDGLCGANCRHHFSVYFEGQDNPFEHFDSEENKVRYAKEQRQRALERRIRKTKRECIGLKEAVDNAEDEQLKFELDLQYQRKADLLARQNQAYNDYCERNGLKRLSDRIQIAQWDRKQAAASISAAKRYRS